MLISLGCKLDQCDSAEEAEALALMHGLREFAKIFTGPVQVEVDCQALAKALAPGCTNKTGLFPIIAGFESLEIRWINREKEQSCSLPGLASEELWRFPSFRFRTKGDEGNPVERL